MRRAILAVLRCGTGENGMGPETGERMAAGRDVMDKRGISAGYA